MGTSQNQCINIFILQFLQITGCHFSGHRILSPAFLYQWYKQRACFANHLSLWLDLMNKIRIQSAGNGSLCGNYTDPVILCCLTRNLGSRFYHANDRNIHFLLHLFQRQCTCCITGYHQCLHILSLKEMNNLSGKPYDGLF